MRRFALVLLALTALAPALTVARPAAAAGSYVYWFPWYDNASPGMQVDNIHAVNPGSTVANVVITIPGAATITAQVQPFAENFWSYPYQSTIGGPLEVASDQALIVTQRVTYGLSFNEFPAASKASTSLWFPWYDRLSPAVHGDNIHIVNPGAVTANVAVTLGQSTFSYSLVVPPHSATYHAFPSGFIGGPVHVQSDQPVIASQRVQYNQSFNELPGTNENDGATFQVINWYDQASPGYNADDIHVLNPWSAGTANVTLHFAGHPDVRMTIPPRTDAFANYNGQIGGAITITSDLKVIATQRVDYWGSFKEYRALTPADASPETWFNWYDNASPCMVQNNIHLYSAGHSTGTISLGSPALSMPFDVSGESWYSFPLGTIGGPVHIHVDAGAPPVYPESRTVRCPPPPPPPPAVPVALPLKLRLPGLGVYANVESVGTDSTGAMGVPTNVYDVAWFNQMPRPGDTGDSVMTGHVDWYGVPCAVFCNLTSSWIGMDMYVDRADGTTAHFVVDGMNYYPATSPPDWLYTTAGGPQLTLITCSGDLVGGHYTDRFLVHGHIV